MPDEPAFPPLTLIAKNVAASRAGRAVFGEVSFSLRSGDVLAIKGPNGAGKSTLLRLVAGLLRPASGEILLEPADGEVAEARAHYVGHLDALKAALTVRENLLFWSRLWRRGAEGVDAALTGLGVAALAHLPVAVLSAGQRRRTALARLLLAPRPLWLLDEPSASLDAAGERLLGELISAHARRGGIALIATHAELPSPPTQILTFGAA
jgi:heme exporter protein A